MLGSFFAQGMNASLAADAEPPGVGMDFPAKERQQPASLAVSATSAP
jgi:hypothetical protein